MLLSSRNVLQRKYLLNVITGQPQEEIDSSEEIKESSVVLDEEQISESNFERVPSCFLKFHPRVQENN